jgi:hypothetical protein
VAPHPRNRYLWPRQRSNNQRQRPSYDNVVWTITKSKTKSRTNEIFCEIWRLLCPLLSECVQWFLWRVLCECWFVHSQLTIKWTIFIQWQFLATMHRVFPICRV